MAELENGPFTAALLRLIRAQDSYGGLDRKSDQELLKGYLNPKPDPFASPSCKPREGELARLDRFIGAVAREVERRSGLASAALQSVNQEGFGQAVVCVGRLVVLRRYVRSIGKQGFASLEALENEGESLVAQALSQIELYPQAARAGL